MDCFFKFLKRYLIIKKLRRILEKFILYKYTLYILVDCASVYQAKGEKIKETFEKQVNEIITKFVAKS